jgi:hypothetical protein
MLWSQVFSFTGNRPCNYAHCSHDFLIWQLCVNPEMEQSQVCLVIVYFD